METRRGDIFLANLFFDEQGERKESMESRPVVVLVDSENNEEPILVIPISSKIPRLKKAKYVQLNPEYYGFNHDMRILTSQLTTISKKRLVKKIARLSNNDLKRIENAIVEEFSDSIFEKSDSDKKMKVYKDFFIEGSSIDISNLYEHLSTNVHTEIWSINDEKSFSDFLVFKRKSTSDLSGVYLFLNITDTKLEITNIVPTEKNSLTYDEYNNVIDEFYEEFIKPYIVNFHTSLEITSSSSEVSIDDFSTKVVTDKLIAFSSAANKATGSSHPLDQKRWYDFIITSFKKNKLIPTNILYRWLVEEGWSEDLANQLVMEYEKAIGLLELYNESNAK